MVAYRTVDPAPARPPRYSFLDLVAEVDDDHRFTEGIRWIPETVGGGQIGAIDPTRGNLASREGDAQSVPTELTADPILLWYGESASTLGMFGRDFEGRVRRGLAATESYQAALEFWDGAIANANSHGQNWLASLESDRLTDISGGAVDVQVAFGAIEAGLAAALDGQPGLIHCTPQVLVHAHAERCIIREGNLWRSVMGHLVVADAGYSGNGPGDAEPADSTSQFMYATSQLRVRLGPVTVNPMESRVGVDYPDNDVIVLAHRPAVVEWNENVHLAAEVNIGTVDIGGSS